MVIPAIVVLIVVVPLATLAGLAVAAVRSHVTDTAEYEDDDDTPLTEWFDCEPEPEPGRHRLVVPTIGDRRRAQWNRETREWPTLLASHAAETYAGWWAEPGYQDRRAHAFRQSVMAEAVA